MRASVATHCQYWRTFKPFALGHRCAKRDPVHRVTSLSKVMIQRKSAPFAQGRVMLFKKRDVPFLHDFCLVHSMDFPFHTTPPPAACEPHMQPHGTRVVNMIPDRGFVFDMFGNRDTKIDHCRVNVILRKNEPLAHDYSMISV